MRASKERNVGRNVERNVATTRGMNSSATTTRRRSSAGRLKKRGVSGKNRNEPNDNGRQTSTGNSRNSAVTRNFNGSATRKISATKSSVAPTKNKDDARSWNAEIAIRRDSANGNGGRLTSSGETMSSSVNLNVNAVRTRTSDG